MSTLVVDKEKKLWVNKGTDPPFVKRPSLYYIECLGNISRMLEFPNCVNYLIFSLTI